MADSYSDWAYDLRTQPLRDRIEELEASDTIHREQRDNWRAANDQNKEKLSFMTKECQKLEAEHERLRAVYEAACAQQAILSTKPLWLEIREYATVIALGDAITNYEAQEKDDG